MLNYLYRSMDMNIFEIDNAIMKLEQHINVLEKNPERNNIKIKTAEKEYGQLLKQAYDNNCFDAYLVDVLSEYAKTFNRDISDIKISLYPVMESNNHSTEKLYSIFVKIPSNTTRSSRIFGLNKAITQESLDNSTNDNIVKEVIKKYNGRCDFSLTEKDLDNDLKIKTYPYSFDEELRTPLINSIKTREEKDRGYKLENDGK